MSRRKQVVYKLHSIRKRFVTVGRMTHIAEWVGNGDVRMKYVGPGLYGDSCGKLYAKWGGA